MDAIRRIIAEITFICRTREVPVSDTLAAFVAHSVVLGQPEQFPLDRELNEADVQELVHVAVERLLAADSASLETIKMQVAFDIAKLEEADALKAAQGAREEREGSLLAGIVDARLKDGNNDVEALTALYRRIFNYLVVRAGLELGADRPAEREIAAALESVFPRIGLKPFTHLPAEDKGAQLHELANIVLGIRLFNRALGKGGAGIADHAALGRQRASELLHGAGSELEQVGQLCEQYAEVLSFRHGPHRQEALRALDAPSRARDAARTVRLQEELANRRQYGASLSDLFGGLQASAKRLAQLERAQAKVSAARGGGAAGAPQPALRVGLTPLPPPARPRRAGAGEPEPCCGLAGVCAKGGSLPALRRARKALGRVRGGGGLAGRAQEDARGARGLSRLLCASAELGGRVGGARGEARARGGEHVWRRGTRRRADPPRRRAARGGRRSWRGGRRVVLRRERLGRRRRERRAAGRGRRRGLARGGFCRAAGGARGRAAAAAALARAGGLLPSHARRQGRAAAARLRRLRRALRRPPLRMRR